MSKVRSFSIYLLKEGQTSATALKDDHKLLENLVAANLPEGSELFVLDNPARAPWWRSYFGVEKQLLQASKGAMLFLPVGERCFAISFGHVFHNLDDAAYEYDFGLRVTLNAVDPDKLRSTDTLEPGDSRRRRTQVPVESELTLFDFDQDSAVLKSLTGKVKPEYSEWFRQSTGSSNLRISSDLEPNELHNLCAKLMELYESDDYENHFPDIQNISPVKDPVFIDELNSKLIEAFRKKDEGLNLTVPEILNYQDDINATFSGCGAGKLYRNVFAGRYYSYLDDRKIPLAKIGFDELKKHQLKLVDEDNQPKGGSYSIYKCLLYDIAMPDEGGTYHLTEGNWYRVDDDYVARMKAYLDERCIDLKLPQYNHAKEADYNIAVAEQEPHLLCLDRKNISPTKQKQIEPCDVLAHENEFVNFYHVKVSVYSSTLSHLFNQGLNSTEILRMNEEARKKLSNLVNGSNLEEDQKEALGSLLDKQAFKVTYGIVTHKPPDQLSDNLPLFSRISLMRTMKTFSLWGVPASYGFISDQRPTLEGKKKSKKKSK